MHSYRKEIISYYSQEHIQKHLFKHIENRGLSFRLFDHQLKEKGFQHSLTGLKKSGFLSEPLPEWVKDKIELIYREADESEVPYLVCRNKKQIDQLINEFPLKAGSMLVEFHSWLTRLQDLHRPDFAVINLRPDKENLRFDYVIEAALAAKETIEVPTFVKTSEERGLHIYIPLNAHFKFDFVQDLANGLARKIHQQCSGITTIKTANSGRSGRVLLDVSQNNNQGSVISPYSLIAEPFGLVATPLKWEEVNSSLDPGKFNIQTITKRLEEVGDLFEGIVI